MNDNKNPKSTFSSIIPYLLITVVVALILWWVISSSLGGSTIINPNLVDDYFFATSSAGSSPSTGQYYVPTYTARVGSEVTTIEGTAVTDKDGKLASAPFTVSLSTDRWNEDWVVGNVVQGEEYDTNIYYTSGEVVYHKSYSTLFEGKIKEWRTAFPNYSNSSYGYYTVKSAYETTWWDSWGPTIIWLLIMGVMIFFVFRMFASVGSGGGRSAMDFTRSPARRVDKSGVKFDDVAGCDEEKAEMIELVEYLKDPKKYSKFGARLPKGVLLVGSPGTGKTLLAKAVAGEAGVPFYSISGSDFVEMFVGVGAGRVRDLFKKAKATSPCLIFIDELDAVGRQRGAGLGGGNDEREQTLNQVLVEMDGFEPNAGILVIAATNRADVLDPALMRPGRFDRIITVSLPDRAGREAIFKVHARNKTIDNSIDWSALAKRTVGFSGADIANILNEAAILAVRGNKTMIGIEEIDEAIDRRIAGPAKSGKGMSPEERRQVAYHEAGHAVIGLTLPFSDKVQKITIIPRGQTGGHVLMTPEDDRFLMTKKQLIARITGLLGGRSSEEIFFDDISTGAQNDIEEATRIARLMVTEFGMSSLGPVQYEKDSSSVFLGRDYTNVQKNFSTQVAYEIDTAVRQIIDAAHLEARRILIEHKDQVRLIAETLLEKETITAEEIQQLVENGKLVQAETGKVKQVEGLENKAEEPKETKPKKAPAKKKAAPKKKAEKTEEPEKKEGE